MEFWLRIGERKGLALATYTFVRYYKIKWWKPPVKPLRHKSFLTSWSSWPYAGRTMILCAMTNQMWCTAFAFLAIHPHLVPSVVNSLHRRKLFPLHWRLQPFKMGTVMTFLVFRPWPHLRNLFSFAQLLQLLCHFRQQHVKFCAPCRQTQFSAWNMMCKWSGDVL